jgi:hypothetical protein
LELINKNKNNILIQDCSEASIIGGKKIKINKYNYIEYISIFKDKEFLIFKNNLLQIYYLITIILLFFIFKNNYYLNFNFILFFIILYSILLSNVFIIILFNIYNKIIKNINILNETNFIFEVPFVLNLTNKKK